MSIKERIKQTTQLIALNEAMIKAARERLKSIDNQLNLKK